MAKNLITKAFIYELELNGRNCKFFEKLILIKLELTFLVLGMILLILYWINSPGLKKSLKNKPV